MTNMKGSFPIFCHSFEGIWVFSFLKISSLANLFGEFLLQPHSYISSGGNSKIYSICIGKKGEGIVPFSSAGNLYINLTREGNFKRNLVSCHSTGPKMFYAGPKI